MKRLSAPLCGALLEEAGLGGDTAQTVLAGLERETREAMGFCALAVLVRRIGGLLARVERSSLSLPSPRFPREALFGWLLDAVIAAVLTWCAWRFPGDPVWPRLFPALALLGFARLVPRLIDGQAGGWIADRAVLAALLAVTSLGGVLANAVQAFALGLAAIGIAWPIGASRLTRA